MLRQMMLNKPQEKRINKRLMPRHTLRELLTFACFFVLASIVWYGYSMGAVRSMIVPVSLSYSGISPIIQCEDTLPSTIYVEIRDAGQRLTVYRKRPLQLEIDIQDQVKNEQGTIHIASDVLRNSITNLLQGTTKLQLITPDNISCSYHRQHKKSVPVRLNTTFVPLTQYQLVEKPKLLTSSITVYGDLEAIESIDEIETAPITITDVKDTLIADVPIVVPKGLSVNKNSISVQVISEAFTEKVISVPVQVVDVPKGENIRIFPNEVNVILRIGINHFSHLRDQQVKARCQYPTNHNQSRLPIIIECNNKYVTHKRSTPASVEYIIEK